MKIDMGKLFNPLWSTERRSELRGNMTEPEKKLWNGLRRNTLGIKFRRQFGVGPYIVDFCSPMHRIVIEVDGDSHFTPDGLLYDADRDAYLTGLEFRTFRFTNNEVMTNLNGVLLQIAASCPPPFQGGDRGGLTPKPEIP